MTLDLDHVLTVTIGAIAALIAGKAAGIFGKGMSEQRADSQNDALQTENAALKGTNDALDGRIECLEEAQKSNLRRIEHLEQLVADLSTENRRLRTRLEQLGQAV